MAKKKKGLFTRLVEGPERSEDYVRKTLPTSRWALGWDLFKTNLGKLAIINVLTMLFVFPVFVLLYLRGVAIDSQAFNSAFSQNIGFGYPAIMPDGFLGIAESIVFNVDIFFFVLLFVFTFLISVGISGGFYVIRNLVWTEGVFVAKDFWSGVKKNYSVVLRASLLYVFFLAIGILTIDLCNLQIAVKSSMTGLFTAIIVISYVLIAIVTLIYLFLITVGVTYKHTFTGLLRNSLILSIGFLPINIFYALFAVVWFLLLLFEMESILFAIGLMLLLVLSISLFMLIWTNYSQWLFDEVINDNVAGAKKYRGIYKKGATVETEEFVYKKNILTAHPVKPITDDEIEIAALPESYSRADLIRLQESKELMIKDSEEYVKTHSQDDKDAIDEFMNSETTEKKTPTKNKKKSGKK